MQDSPSPTKAALLHLRWRHLVSSLHHRVCNYQRGWNCWYQDPKQNIRGRERFWCNGPERLTATAQWRLLPLEELQVYWKKCHRGQIRKRVSRFCHLIVLNKQSQLTFCGANSNQLILHRECTIKRWTEHSHICHGKNHASKLCKPLNATFGISTAYTYETQRGRP